MSNDNEELVREEFDDDSEVRYQITPWGCLFAVLTEYGVDVGHISGRIGGHIVDDFMDVMQAAGYVSKGGD